MTAENTDTHTQHTCVQKETEIERQRQNSSYKCLFASEKASSPDPKEENRSARRTSRPQGCWSSRGCVTRFSKPESLGLYSQLSGLWVLPEGLGQAYKYLLTNGNVAFSSWPHISQRSNIVPWNKPEGKKKQRNKETNKQKLHSLFSARP